MVTLQFRIKRVLREGGFVADAAKRQPAKTCGFKALSGYKCCRGVTATPELQATFARGLLYKLPKPAGFGSLFVTPVIATGFTVGGLDYQSGVVQQSPLWIGSPVVLWQLVPAVL